MNKKHLDGIKKLYAREKFLVISNISIMTVTFLVLGFFLSVSVGFQTAIKTLEEQAQVTLFFKDEFSEESILELQQKLMVDARVLEVTYVSKEDAFRIFTNLNKDEPILLEAVSKDILPASLEIKTTKLTSLSELAAELEEVEGIEEIKFFKDIVDTFRYWARVISVVGGILIIVFLGLSFAIIMATLRLMISTKGEELEIMKLVGASDKYVRDPLLFQGTVFGLISATIASVLLILLFTSINFFGSFDASSMVAILPGVKVTSVVFLVILVFLLLLSGGLLGYIGSHTALKRYLKF